VLNLPSLLAIARLRLANLVTKMTRLVRGTRRSIAIGPLRHRADRLLPRSTRPAGGPAQPPIPASDCPEPSFSEVFGRYLETSFPDRPFLFRGASGEALSCFVLHWTTSSVHLC
jgi:hypothetical protein